MPAPACAALAALVLGVLLPLPVAAQGAAPPSAAELMGTWVGYAMHGGDSTVVALVLAPADSGRIALRLTLPVIHVRDLPLGADTLRVLPEGLGLGPFTLRFDRARGTLSGFLPAAFVPVYRIPVTLSRAPVLDLPPRTELAAPPADLVWVSDSGAPLWGGTVYADGVVYAGGEDGRLRALDAATGRERWSFHAAGAIRARVAVAGEDVYLHADDGFLYRLDAARGVERWRVRVDSVPVRRLAPGDPRSRYDRFGAEPVAADGLVYVGTYDGRIMALGRERGAVRWAFATGEAILAAPAVAPGRVFAGSYDGHVYALDAATGRELWRADTRGPVVSTPALAGDGLVVGSRSYDLLGLDAGTGAVRWKRYYWFSWVESSASVRDGVAYVGSSDAVGLYAFDARTGARVWAVDVHGWPWGQPAVTDGRVYIGTAGSATNRAYQGGALAVDRRSGQPVWRWAATPSAAGQYGLAAAPAVGQGFVFFAGLDGRVYAFRQ